MKIDRSTKVAVAVDSCTVEQKGFVWGFFRPHYIPGKLSSVECASTISNNGFMNKGRSYDDEYYRGEGCPTITYREFMLSINPYADKKVQVKCGSEKEYLGAQEHSFDLGYSWYSDHTNESNRRLGLGFRHPMKLTHSSEEMAYRYDYVITFAEFMALELPDSCQTTPLPFGMVPPPEPHVHYCGPVKDDAYISQDGKLYYWNGNSIVQEDIRDAYTYNLSSEELFKAKYEKKELKFGHWAVKVDGEFIKIGCKRIYKGHIDGFLRICKELQWRDDRGTPIPTLDATHSWLVKHAKELGL